MNDIVIIISRIARYNNYRIDILRKFNKIQMQAIQCRMFKKAGWKVAGNYARKTETTVVNRVIDAITSDIIEGRLLPGDKLPTEMELCAKYGAGRNSVREAIKQLEANGVVYIKRADGTFVSDAYSPKLLDPMLYSIILQENSRQDFVKLRSVIDIGILHVILENADTKKIVPELMELLDKMEAELKKKEPDPSLVVDLDVAFHSRIVEAAGNPQLETIMDYIIRLTVFYRRENLLELIQRGETGRFIALHRRWLEVMENRDVEHIDQAVLDHYVILCG